MPLIKEGNENQQPYKLLRFKNKWVPCTEKACGVDHKHKFKRVSLDKEQLVIESNKKSASIDIKDLTCSQRGESKLCMTFSPNAIIPLTSCMEGILQWQEEKIRKNCPFDLKDTEEVHYTPIQVSPNTYMVHRNALKEHSLFLQEKGNDTNTPIKVNLTNGYCHEVKITPSGKTFDLERTWERTNTENMFTSEGREVNPSDLFN